MKGVSAKRDSNGNVVFINAVGKTGLPNVYKVAQYESRGYELDWRALPDEDEMT